MGVQSASITVNLKAKQTGANDLGTPNFEPSLAAALSFTGGTLANQVDRMFFDERTVGAASNDDIDLAGALIDAYGATITFAEIAAILIVASASNANLLSIGGGSNPWITWLIATGDGVKVPPGGVFLLAGPDGTGLGAVTAGTGDILRIGNAGGAPCTFKIAILGRSA